MAKDPNQPRLGKWKVRKVDAKTIEIVIPDGMKIEGDAPLTIDDIKDAIESHEIASGGITPQCCRRRVMIA